MLISLVGLYQFNWTKPSEEILKQDRNRSWQLVSPSPYIEIKKFSKIRCIGLVLFN